MSERDVVNAVLLALSAEPGVRVWRHNVGAMKSDTGRFVRFGLPGQSDISGILSPEGWRLEVEAKTQTGRLSESQRRWLDMINNQGGIAFIARDPHEAVRVLRAEVMRRRNHGRQA